MKTNVKKAQKDFVQNLNDKGRSTATILAYTRDLDQLVEHLFSEEITALEDVTSKHLLDFIEKLKKTANLTPKSISRKINSIRSFYKYLTNSGAVKENIATALSHPKLESKAPNIMSKTEFMALREVARRDTKLYTMVEVLLQLGIRISELSGMEVAHLDLSETATLFIPKRESQKERVVPLNKKAKEALQAYLEVREEDSNYVFATKSGRAMLVRNIRASMNRLFKRAGLNGVTVNDLRHTFTAYQLSSGVSVHTVCRVTGHKTLSTTQKYLKHLKMDKGGNKETLEEL
jgi:integrase/recombinase XerD